MLVQQMNIQVPYAYQPLSKLPSYQRSLAEKIHSVHFTLVELVVLPNKTMFI